MAESWQLPCIKNESLAYGCFYAQGSNPSFSVNNAPVIRRSAVPPVLSYCPGRAAVYKCCGNGFISWSISPPGTAVSLRVRCEQKPAPGCAGFVIPLCSECSLSRFLRPFTLRSGSSRVGGWRTMALLQPPLRCPWLVRHLPSPPRPSLFDFAVRCAPGG